MLPSPLICPFFTPMDFASTTTQMDVPTIRSQTNTAIAPPIPRDLHGLAARSGAVILHKRAGNARQKTVGSLNIAVVLPAAHGKFSLPLLASMSAASALPNTCDD